MNTTLNKAENIKQIFADFCKEKNYNFEENKDTNGDWRLDISNLREKTIVKVYHTGTILIQGQQNSLKEEFEVLKQDIENNAKSIVPCIKSLATKYIIQSNNLRIRIKENLKNIIATSEIDTNPNSTIDYIAKLSRNSSTVVVTQFSNGTLLLQGKTGALFEESCDLIEKIGNPDEEQVVARFISKNEESLKHFIKIVTPKVLELADCNILKKLGGVYNYIENHDRKWFVASEVLCITPIPLPEYTPLVMPASKAFEGFSKKILVDVEFYEKDHFKLKTSKFENLSSKKHNKRINLCKKERHAGSFLDRISVDLDRYRNFMMHSDDSDVTKIESPDDAEKILIEICKETKEIFEYFNKYFLS